MLLTLLIKYAPTAATCAGLALLASAAVLGARGKGVRYRAIKAGLLLIFVGPALHAALNLLDPASAAAAIRSAAEANLGRVGGRAWFTTELLSAALNLSLGLVLVYGVGAFQRPASGLGRGWPLVAELAAAVSRYARGKAASAVPAEPREVAPPQHEAPAAAR